MNNFGIIGYGVVGKATHLGLLNSAAVKYHDPAYNTMITDLHDCDVLFFCTPTAEATDIEILIELIVKIKELNPNATIVIRSTVPIGTCKSIQDIINDTVFYIPEFLRDRSWKADCQTNEIVVGHESYEIPTWLYEKKVNTCSLEEAEILKMFSNNYAALRIVFANHFYELSKLHNSDYTKIADLYSKIEHDQTYLDVTDKLRGFGGKCLPKDLDFIIETFVKSNLPQTLFTSLKRDNLQWPIHVKKY